MSDETDYNPLEVPTSTGFTVWDPATGQIVNSGICPPHMIALQAPPGFDFVDECFDDGLYFMPGGVPTLRPPRPVPPDPLPPGDPVPLPGVLDGADLVLTDAFDVSHRWTYAADDPLILTDPGRYALQIRQAFPAHIASFEIEVTDA